MSFDFDPTNPQQQLDPNPDMNDTGLQWWSNETRENAERAVIAARQADMALHVAKTASNMAIAAAGHLIRDNLLANTKMSARTYMKLLREPEYIHWDGVLGGRDSGPRHKEGTLTGEHLPNKATENIPQTGDGVQGGHAADGNPDSVKVASQVPTLFAMPKRRLRKQRMAIFL